MVTCLLYFNNWVGSLVLGFKNVTKVHLSLWNLDVEKRTTAHVGELSLRMGPGLTLPLIMLPFPFPYNRDKDGPCLTGC